MTGRLTGEELRGIELISRIRFHRRLCWHLIEINVVLAKLR